MEGNRTRTLGGRTAAAVASSTSRSRDESGAVLVLALMFLVVVGLIVGAMASWTANSLSNSLNFQRDRTAQYALSSASQVAIQNIRYTPLLGPNQTLNASPPSYCWGTSSPSQLTFGTNTVDVWCSTVWNPTSASTRVVTVSACLTSVTTDAATCAKNPGLQTIVTFDDYSASSPKIRPQEYVCTADVRQWHDDQQLDDQDDQSDRHRPLCRTRACLGRYRADHHGNGIRERDNRGRVAGDNGELRVDHGVAEHRDPRGQRQRARRPVHLSDRDDPGRHDSDKLLRRRHDARRVEPGGTGVHSTTRDSHGHQHRDRHQRDVRHASNLRADPPRAARRSPSQGPGS